MKTKTKKRFTARLTKKGQVTIPIFLRETLQVNPHEEIEFVLDEDNIVSLWKREEEVIFDAKRDTNGQAPDVNLFIEALEKSLL